jgi:hypothetical protein
MGFVIIGLPSVLVSVRLGRFHLSSATRCKASDRRCSRSPAWTGRSGGFHTVNATAAISISMPTILSARRKL